MGRQLHIAGEEFYTKFIWTREASDPVGVNVGLYDDSTDSLTELDDIGSITTEPDGASYGRVTVTMDSTDITSNENANDNWEALFKDLTYDLSDSSNPDYVDSYFVVFQFQSEHYGDSSANTHIMFTGALSQQYEISSSGTITVTQTGTIQTGNI